jgi:ATPase subunit of ABC transporter with duplicated ATPase domains
VQSRKKEIERLESTELKKSNIQRPYVRFDIKKPSGREVLSATNLSQSFLQVDGSMLKVFEDYSISIGRGERIAVIGNNGVGKTTLLRILAQDLTPDVGRLEFGHEVSVGYFPQDYKEGIARGMTAYKWLESFSGDEGAEVLSGLLGRMLFSGESRLKMTDNLSGGESARLIIAKLMLQQNNVLILDEPTNHLDLESVSALAEALEKYQGTSVVVSHDRDLVSRFATRVIEIVHGEILDYTGTFDEFVEWKQRTGEAKK